MSWLRSGVISEDFAAEMFEPFARADQRRWGGVYLRGLLLDGGRKSVEPMAARLGEEENRQALARFVTSSPWDAAHVRARPAWRMQPVIKPTALVIDDTGSHIRPDRLPGPLPLDQRVRPHRQRGGVRTRHLHQSSSSPRCS
ncbi:transposase [Streptomyces sp. NPDC006261]|uniref:transposase n=1 Tax=Streptomyces sp. NPDC006261 TaxID=3156739 RepID=UPI0033A8DA6B